MKHPTPGRLRHRVDIEAPSRTSDGVGGATEIWSPIATLWARVMAHTGRERLEADAVAGTLTHIVWLRWRSDLVPGLRIAHAGRRLEIRAVVDLDGARRFLACHCEELGL